MNFNAIQDIQDILKSQIYVVRNKVSYIFEDDAYAVLPGNFSLLIQRNNIVWENIKAKHKYSILQHESNFIFRTYENELFSGENEFIISIEGRQNNTYTIILKSIRDKFERLMLHSE